MIITRVCSVTWSFIYRLTPILHCSGTTPGANITLKSLVNMAVVCLGDFFRNLLRIWSVPVQNMEKYPISEYTREGWITAAPRIYPPSQDLPAFILIVRSV